MARFSQAWTTETPLGLRSRYPMDQRFQGCLALASGCGTASSAETSAYAGKVAQPRFRRTASDTLATPWSHGSEDSATLPQLCASCFQRRRRLVFPTSRSPQAPKTSPPSASSKRRVANSTNISQSLRSLAASLACGFASPCNEDGQPFERTASGSRSIPTLAVTQSSPVRGCQLWQ